MTLDKRALTGLGLGCVLLALPQATIFIHLGAAEPPAPPPFTLEQVLSVPTASAVVAAPTGRALAWVVNDKGRRNVWVAEGAELRARQVTAFAEDDGQQLTELGWTPGSRAIVFARGYPDGTAGEPLNPTSDINGTTRSIWVVPLATGAPRQLAEGQAPEVAPRGDRVAFLHDGHVWSTRIARGAAPGRLFATRGQVSNLTWSPEGAELAFSAARGGHTVIGVFRDGRRTIEYLSPSFDRDLYPQWSPDGRHIAFVRMINEESTLRASGRFGPIDSRWAVMVASRPSGEAGFREAVEVWRSPRPPIGSFPRNVQLLAWIDGNRLVFASEHENWAHLYLADPARPGGAPALLTPGACEVDGVALAADRRSVFFQSNCGDLERRHLWRVGIPASGIDAVPAPEAMTSGTSIQTAPAPTADGTALAFLQHDPRTPPRPHLMTLAGRQVRPLAPVSPRSLQAGTFVEPRVAVLKAPDGLEIRAVVLAPPTAVDAATVRHPALIHVHGGPTAGQETLGWQAVYQHLVARGFVVLGLNYRGGAGYGRSFREVPTQGAAGASEYQDVLAAAEYLRSRPDVDPAHLGIWGASYGGYLTQLALARNSDVFAAGVTECGILDMAANARPTQAASRGGDAARIARDSSAIGSIDKWKSPVLVVHGDDDAGVDFNTQTVALVRALRAHGVLFEQLVFADEGHGSSVWAHALRVHQATAEFFGRMLMPSSPPTAPRSAAF